MAKPTTQRTWRTTLVVAGRDCGIWDQRSGGKQSSSGSTYMPGNMAPQISLPPGPPSIDTVVMERLFDGDRDMPLMAFFLDANVKGETATVKQRPLDGDGSAYGSSLIWTGKVTAVNPPETDSTSTNPAKLQLEITPDGPVITS